jgi:hypothetical protein
VVSRPLESPFLDDELFTRESAPDLEPRASALVAQSPFLDALAPASLDANLQDDVGEALDEEPYEYREPIEQESDEGYGFRHELDERGGDEQAADKAEEETEDEFGSFEGFAPKVSAATLRTRIGDYFDLVNTEYMLTDGTKVKARSQFRYAKSGGIDQAKTRLAKTLGPSFEKKHPGAIHYAVYGRPKPAQIAAITQALIDAGQFDALRKKYRTLTDRQLIRRMQREFGIGIDCAGYVQLAFIYAFTGSDDDPKKTRLNLGLQERRGNERLSDLPSSHFKKLASVTDAETGDLLVLRPRDGDIDRAWHTVMIVERTFSGTEHTFLGDASWGTDLYGENAGGIGRRQLVHDTATGEWWDIHPLTGTEAHRNAVGPYAEHHLHGVFRARQSTKTAKPTPELETWLEEAETSTESGFGIIGEDSEGKTTMTGDTGVLISPRYLQSPFLGEELFVRENDGEWGRHAAELEAPKDPPAPPPPKCGFHGPNGAFVTEADLRADVVTAALAERKIWWGSTGNTAQKEDANARFGDLVRYWLAGRTGTIRPGKLEAVQQAALDPSVTYSNLGDATLNAAIQKFSIAEAQVNARIADVYNKSDVVDSAKLKVKATETEVKQATAEVRAAEVRVKAAHGQSGSGAQAALDTERTALKAATTALTGAQKDRDDAKKALGVATAALKMAKRSHEHAKAVRDSLKPPAQNWTQTDRRKIRKEILAKANAILVKAGSPDAQDIDDLIETELQLAHQSRADIEPWSAVFVVSCVRAAGIGRKLEAIDSSGAHRGRNGLLKASRRHSDYVVEARERRRKGVGGTYHAFEPTERAVQVGDIICTDRTDFIEKPARLKDLGRDLHGDIVTLVKTENGKPVWAETIGGNVGHTVRRRRYPLDVSGRLIVSSGQLFAQEDDNGAFGPFKTLAPVPTMLAVASTGRILALISLAEECKPASGVAPVGKSAPVGKQERFVRSLIESLDSPFLDQQILRPEPQNEYDPSVERLVAESPFEQFRVEIQANESQRQDENESERSPSDDQNLYAADAAELSVEAMEQEEELSLDAGEYEEEVDLEREDEDLALADMGADGKPDEEWSDVEYDVPTASSSNIPDSLLAVPAFADDKRALIGKLLTPALSKAAIRWNAKNHPGKSGVNPDSILGALQSYVDLSAVSSAIARHNSQNPSARISLGAKPVDAVFVEAIHQFQAKCYKRVDSKQHGVAGPSVLDSLGFWPRKGLLSSAQTNEWAKGRVRSRRKEIEQALSTSTDLTGDLTQSNWWTSFVNPCFLGWGFVRPIHIYFARKLRKAELWLLSQPRFTGKTPVELAALLDINEKHAGGRSKSGSKSIHTLGLGIDIKYLGNPHVGDYRDKPMGAERFSEVVKRAVAKISGLTLSGETFPKYLNNLGTDTSKTTGQIYDELVQRDQDLRRYLALAEAGEDLAALRGRGSVFKGAQDRDPLRGFLNLDRDLVIALRDHACLVWGAVDLGPGASGDIMHFDCRLDDIGRAVYCGTGGTFNDKHPCWKRSEPPCPQATERTRRAPARAGEILDSECEDDSLAEDDYLAAASEEQPVEYLADEDDEITDELDETEELDEFTDYETGEQEEGLLETEAPPLLKNPASSDPPGQTLYVEIKLGRDRRCVNWIEENKRKKCVEYKTFVVRPMTGIFIPENYSLQPSVDLILYLHGHKTAIPGSDALIAEYWDGQKHPVFALREEINASRRNVILVAPTLALKSEAGDLVRRNGLDNYLEKVLEALRTYGPYQGQSPTIGNLILAAHSGGGVYMRLLATSGNRAASNIRECWGFDSLYSSADVEPWRLWAKNDPQTRRLYSYYRRGLPKTNSERLEKDSRGRVDKLPNIFPIPSQESDHFKLVGLYLRERLKGATFLGSTAARQGSEQLFDEAGGDLRDEVEDDIPTDEITGLDVEEDEEPAEPAYSSVELQELRTVAPDEQFVEAGLEEGIEHETDGHRVFPEREIGLLWSGDDSEGWSEFESSSPAPRAPAAAKRSVDLATAGQVMWEIIRIINRQKDLNEADPDKLRSPPAWHRLYAPVLKQWFVLTYGEPSGTARKRPQGDTLRTKVDAAFMVTQPLLDVLKKSGGAKWGEQLRQFFYAKIADLEEEAIRTGPVTPPAGTIQVTFPERPPKPVSLEEFFSVVATRESKPIEIQRGMGGYSLGNAKAGDVFSTSQQEQRVLLWSDGGAAVLFERDGVIYAQSGKGFSEDVILGAFVLAAQNAAGSAMLAQLMVEVGLSFTPWGVLWDGVSALKALTERDWKGAALALLPGPALNLASKSRAFRAVARGAAVSGTVAVQIAKRAVRFVGRGAYWLKGKWLRGIWVVGEAGGAGGRQSYRFFDDVGKQWHDVEEAVAKDYIKCSVCSYTARGKAAALIGDVDAVFADLARSPVYASRGRVLIPRKLVKDVMEAYGPWGDHVVQCILDTWSTAPNAVKLAEDALAIAKDLSRIKGARGYQDAIDIFEDLASSSKYTPRGAMYELEWAAKHVDEIAAMGVPAYRKGWMGVGKGLDILKKNGAAIELKNFDFTSRFYKDDPGRAVARIAKQAESRLKLSRPKVSSVMILFDSRGGLMPPAFERELTGALSELEKRYGVGKSKVTFGFWP